MDTNKTKSFLIGAFIGGLLLGIFSAIQKSSLGVNIFLPEGYIVPFFFGGCSGGITAFLTYRWKNDMREKLRLEKDLSSKLDSEVERKTQNLKNTNDLLELLNDTLTHDISNDLSVIHGNINLYLNLRKDKFLYEIKNTTEKSINLVDKMRNLEKIIGSNVDLKPINLIKVLNELKDEYSLNINIEGNAVVYGDEILTSVFDNLIRNVRDHADTDRIKIKIDESTNGKYSIIFFRDDGIGIPKNVRKNIFKKGFKSNKTGNLGIGLYIVKKTIERYGGSIELLNSSRKGTTFKIKLRKAN